MGDITFSAGTLSSLTNRIEAGLKPGKLKDSRTKTKKLQVKSDDKNRVEQEKTNGTNTGAPKTSSGQRLDGRRHKTTPKLVTTSSVKIPNETSPSVKRNLKGKKRLRDGQAKENKSVSGKLGSVRKDISKDMLAVGGTEEDIALVDGVESGSELEGTNGNDPKGIDKELKKMIKELGISKAAANSAELASDEDMDVVLEPSNPNDIALQPSKRPASSTSGLIFEPRGEWHSASLPSVYHEAERAESLPEDAMERLHEYAKELLQKESETYALINKSASSAHQFYSTIMTSGTLSDKISALTLSVQESPLHNQRALDILVGLAKKRSRGQAIEVLTALKDLLGPGSLLPSDRRLRTFATQPALFAVNTKELRKWKVGQELPSPLAKSHMLSWAFEDYLKSTFFDILKILETWCNDEIVYARTKALDIVFELLRDKPEQETNLLRLLVNKLGDTEKKIASRASYNLLQLQLPHPLMKPTIISAIEGDVLFRPGQSLHAKYYAVITLNQTVLSSKEDSVVRKVLNIYFSLFMLLLAKPESKQNQTEPAKAIVNKKGERQGGGGQPGKMAMKKQKPQASGISPDTEIRERIMSAVLTGINRALPYTDTNDEFFEKHLDTLFRITHSSNFNTSIQALMLIQQLCGSHQAASDRFYKTLYESLLDPRLLTTSKQLLYLNLLYRALRADLNVKRVKAFEKRLLQVLSMHQPAFACAVLYLLRELEGVFPALSTFADEPEEGAEDEEERYYDIPEGDDAIPSVHPSEGSPTHRRQYDGRKRAPEHSDADQSCLWEIDAFTGHYHPSVALFASRLIKHEPMPPKPTLDAHTLKQFLDRFVYKNPKKTTNKMHGSSVMQPMAGEDKGSLLVTTRSSRDKIPVNSDAFYRMSGDKVDADDAFFHKYFNTKAKGRELAKSKKNKKKQGSEAGGEDEDEDEDEIWQALVDSRPELEGSDAGDDGDMDDFSDLEGYSDEEDMENGDAPAVEGDKHVFSDTEQMEAGGSDDLEFDDEEGALLGSDDELPSDLDDALTSHRSALPGKRERSGDETMPQANGKESKRSKRRKFKNLPTFASADDYAALLGDNADEGMQIDKKRIV